MVSELLYDAGRRRTVVRTFASNRTLRPPRGGEEREAFLKDDLREWSGGGARLIDELSCAAGLLVEVVSVARWMDRTRQTGELFLGVGSLEIGCGFTLSSTAPLLRAVET